MNEKLLLHVGCGLKTVKDTLPGFVGWAEIRLDIDPDVQPDIVGSLTDMRAVPSNSVDAVFSSHNIEHLYVHEVPLALAEFRRVLKPTGYAVITCPDLRAAAKAIVENGVFKPVYTAQDGREVTPLDMIYGHKEATATGNHFMAHGWGYTTRSLTKHLKEAGFGAAVALTDNLSLWALASNQEVGDANAEAMLKALF